MTPSPHASPSPAGDRAGHGTGVGAWRTAVAPAKVNPWLRVGPRRADGYREVDLSLLTLGLADELHARRVPGTASSLCVEGPAATDDVPTDDSNLVLRAAAAVARVAGVPSAAAALEFRLVKHVPSRAGLGGGSSDAAAAALLARELLGAQLGDVTLAGVLAELGSDCPFFVAAAATGFGRGRGRGDLVETLPAPARTPWIALVVPDLDCPTAEVYAALEDGPGRVLDPPPSGLLDSPLEELRTALVNDLEAAALCAVPALTEWRESLDSGGASHFRLSGSGSAFWGLFDDEADGRAALAGLAAHLTSAGLAPRLLHLGPAAGHGVKLLQREA